MRCSVCFCWNLEGLEASETSRVSSLNFAFENKKMQLQFYTAKSEMLYRNNWYKSTFILSLNIEFLQWSFYLFVFVRIFRKKLSEECFSLKLPRALQSFQRNVLSPKNWTSSLFFRTCRSRPFLIIVRYPTRSIGNYCFLQQKKEQRSFQLSSTESVLPWRLRIQHSWIKH